MASHFAKNMFISHLFCVFCSANTAPIKESQSLTSSGGGTALGMTSHVTVFSDGSEAGDDDASDWDSWDEEEGVQVRAGVTWLCCDLIAVC